MRIFQTIHAVNVLLHAQLALEAVPQNVSRVFFLYIFRLQLSSV